MIDIRNLTFKYTGRKAQALAGINLHNLKHDGPVSVLADVRQLEKAHPDWCLCPLRPLRLLRRTNPSHLGDPRPIIPGDNQWCSRPNDNRRRRDQAKNFDAHPRDTCTVCDIWYHT